MTLAEKKQSLLADLSRCRGAPDRLAWLVARARRQPPLDADAKMEANRVPGCLSKLWIAAERRGGQCHFHCDSDSQIVKGLAGLLCEFYSGHRPEEILSLPPEFLAGAGLTQHLTANRRNALSRVWERIRSFAEAPTP
ncbi:MAG: SufE family protein [Verrucomicrobia bacterium]|nr:SufE family protein [Verrucomicrobiota bacterium]